MKNKLLSLFLIFFSLILFGQDQYEKLWAEVEALEIQGKPLSANLIVQQILELADTNNKSDQIVKGFLYHSKFLLMLEEDSQFKVIRNLEQRIDESNFPVNSILESIYASCLAQYYNRNRFKIGNRIKLDTLLADEKIELWDSSRFRENIDRHISASLNDKVRLIAESIEEFQAILSLSNTSRKFRPSLYDFLAHRGLDIYLESNLFRNSLKGSEVRNNPVIFASTNDFVLVDLKVDNPEGNLSLTPLVIFQELETAHRDKDTTAHLTVRLERLKYARKITSLPKRDSLYLNSLTKIFKEYKNHPISATIGYDMASFLYEQSNRSDAKKNPQLKLNRIRAVDICNSVLSKFPNSDGGLMCGILKNKISEKSIDVRTEKYILPDEPFLARLEYQNIDSLYLSLYRISQKDLKYRSQNRKDSIVIKTIVENKPEINQFYNLENVRDYYTYSTEVNLPSLASGSYYLVSSTKEKPKLKSDILSYSDLTASELSFINIAHSKNNTLKVLHRKTGKALKDVNVKITKSDFSLITGKTDRHGEFKYDLENDNVYNTDIQLTFDKDTVRSSNFRTPRSNYSDADLEHLAEMNLFLDRSIYRPGQTLFFKGILLDNRFGKKRVKSNTYVTIVIYDSNGDTLKEYRLKTNEFGSVTGEYTLPKNILTGEFSIDMDEDDGDEEGGYDRYYDDLDDINYKELYFSVEEYKRPKFKVVFENFKDNVKLGDSVLIKGNAKALMGATVGSAKMTYQVSRRLEYNWRSSQQNQAAEIVDIGETQTDEYGEFEIHFKSISESIGSKSIGLVYNYTIQAEVTDVNGETRDAQKTIRLGSNNFMLEVGLPLRLNAEKPQKITFSAKNLNGQPLPAFYDLTINKLKDYRPILRKKRWDLVELPYLSKKRFKELFPYEVYDSTDIKLTREKELTLIESSGSIEDTEIFNFDDISKWESGRYLLEISAEGLTSGKDTFEQVFEIYRPNESTFTKELFEYDILNQNYLTDGYVDLIVRSKFQEFNLNVEAIYHGDPFFKDAIEVKNGIKKIRIPLKSWYKNQIEVKLYSVKLNQVLIKNFKVAFESEVDQYLIESISFRNKITPSAEENWVFKITNKKNKKFKTEALANMYDASLDKFNEHYWETSLTKTNSYWGYSEIDEVFFDLAYSKTLVYPKVLFPFNILKNYHQLDWFGFNFGDTSYSDQQYLSLLTKKLEKQSKTDRGFISGIVVAASDGLPLPGVNVIVKGTDIGTQTDFDGFYSIDASENSVLVFSYVGMLASELKIGPKGTYNIALEDDVATLDEVVISGYAAITKSKSAVSSVRISAETIENYPNASFVQTLSGQVPGLNISTNNGQPGASSVVQLRGVSSIPANSEVLFVVDGVPLSADEVKSLQLSMIEDIQVLKDASATAIYGNRGANGVVLISTKLNTEDLTQVKARSNLKETAFFFPQLKSNRKGEINISFNGPEALTQWKFMLLAHDKNGNTGYLERTLITQKELNVTPNPPRFLRENDTIQLSAKISNLSKGELNGTALLQLFDGLSKEPLDESEIGFISSKSFKVDAKANINVSWSFKVPVNNPLIEYKIVAKAGNYSDGEASVLPVLSNRTLVTESKPIWVIKNQIKQVGFEKIKQNSSKTLKNHRFTLEYSSNPTWLVLKSLPYLMEFPYECSEQTFARLYANALGAQIMTSNPKIKEVFDLWQHSDGLNSELEENEELKSILNQETPWVNDLKSDKEQKSRLADFFDTNRLESEQKQIVNQLKSLQTSSGGFPWFSGGKENTFITRHIVAGIGHLKFLDVKLKNQSDLDGIEKKAISYLDQNLMRDYKQQINLPTSNGQVKLTNNVIHYLYSRSFSKDSVSLSNEAKTIVAYYLEKCNSEWLSQSLYNKGLISLILHRMGYKDKARDIIESLKEQLVRTEERGWYWKENSGGWYWYNSSIETQAVLIEAFVEIKNDQETINQLKLWLLNNKQTNHWDNTKATTEAIYALLMNGQEWISSNSKVEIKIDSNEIEKEKLNTVEAEAGTGYVKLSWRADEITNKFSNININNGGDQPVLGGVYWQYFENLDQITDSEGVPLVVSKELYLKRRTGDGEILVRITKNTKVKIGDLVTVRLKLSVKNDMEYVHLKDLRASGFEPVDVLSEHKWQDGLSFYQSTRDVATNFFFDYISKGSYVFQYDLRANNAGNFSNGYANIQSMYAPQFSGNSKGSRIEIESLDKN